jgi:oxepin-CoA hydrolase/3-oxo-5,6-dehydrosuberyl-CoA semialdehyde dehydrogenase
MKTTDLLNFARDEWIRGAGALSDIPSAVTGETVARTGSAGIDFASMLTHAREVGGPALRRLTFHERAHMLKALGAAIMARKEELYELNFATGATRADGLDRHRRRRGHAFLLFLEGPARTAQRPRLGRRRDGAAVQGGSFVGQHVLTPMQGVAVHINAYNFPVWGMLEKLSVSLLAGVPAIVKPASSTGYLTEAAFRIMIEADILPPGAIQLVMGSVGDMLDHLRMGDIVSFTGSAATAMKLQSNPVFARESVRFVANEIR